MKVLNNTKARLITLVMGSLLMMVSGNSYATPVLCGESTIDNVLTGTYLECRGAFEGNDKDDNQDVINSLDAFITNQGLAGMWTYSESDKSDQTGGFGVFIANPQNSSGTLEFDNPMFGIFAIGLKVSNKFSLFLFEADETIGVKSFDFTTDGVSVNKNDAAAQELSHASFFRFVSTHTEVNAPATSLLFSIVICAFFIRRKK
jgi:hypothetical protein